MGKVIDPKRKQEYAQIFREKTDDGKKEAPLNAYTNILSVKKYGS